MNATLLIGAVLVVGSLFALWWAVSGGSAASLDLRDTAGAGPRDYREVELARPAAERSVLPFLERLGHRLRRITPRGMVDALSLKLARAGSPAGWTGERVVAAKFLLAAAGGGLLIARFVAQPSGFTLVFAVALALFGFFLPDGLLDRRAQARSEVVARDLSNTIDQLTMMVSAGLSFDAAMARVGRDGTGPLAEEFRRVVRDMSVGASRGVALQAFSDRVDLPELRTFVAALAQAELLGVPASETLALQSHELRLKRRQRAEEQAMKLPVKILFPMIICNFPVLFIVLLGPSILRVLDAF